MSKTYNEDVHFAEGLSVGNLAFGIVSVAPSPGEIVSVDVTGLNLEGGGEIFPQAQVHTAWPWQSCSNASVYTTIAGEDVSTVDLWNHDATGFRIHFKRTNNSETWISWMLWKRPT